MNAEDNVKQIELYTLVQQEESDIHKYRTDEPGPPIPEKDGEPQFTKRQIIKNVLVVSIAFVVLFISYGSMANLQSSLNMESGVGSGSLAVIYAAMIISCLFVPSFLIAHIGCKWSIVLSITGYIAYMVANFYPVWATMVPASILIGLGAGPLWSAKCTYLTTLGVWYARMTGQSEDAIINRFFGVFFMFFQSYQIWGNIIIFSIFSSSSSTASNTSDTSVPEQRICGARFCPSQIAASNNTNLERPVDTKIYILCGVFVTCAVSGMFIIILFLDRMKLVKEDQQTKRVSPRVLMASIKHLITSRYQILLVPLTVYSGIEQALIGGDFTRSFITCTLGIHYVGYIMICYGVVDAFCSFLFGQLVKSVGHIPFFVLAFVLHGSCQIVFLLWDPDSNSLYVFYVIAGFWGMGDAVVQTQINALYGLLFKDNMESGFANYRLWESVGFIIQYAYNDYLCTSTKLHISLAILITGMFGYATVEVLHRRENNSKMLGDTRNDITVTTA
ncbi:protein unc-93 homolog A-like [Haliotis cracherodii]|uniref:protein unc-93 homolog A-like n=1 Tax=Haliotis cracherodii TaxID=6455 RepID=UPI0039E8A688